MSSAPLHIDLRGEPADNAGGGRHALQALVGLIGIGLLAIVGLQVGHDRFVFVPSTLESAAPATVDYRHGSPPSSPQTQAPKALGIPAPRAQTAAISVVTGSNTEIKTTNADGTTFEHQLAICTNNTTGVEVWIVEELASSTTGGGGPHCDTCAAGASFPVGHAWVRSVGAPATLNCVFYDQMPMGMSFAAAAGGGGGGGNFVRKIGDTMSGSLGISAVSSWAIDDEATEGYALALDGEAGIGGGAVVSHGTFAPEWDLIFSRGTHAAPTAVQSGDTLGIVGFGGQYTSTPGDWLTAASFTCKATQAWSTANNTGARCSVLTTTNAGVTAERVIVDQNGNMSIGPDTTPDNTLDVQHNATSARHTIHATGAPTDGFATIRADTSPTGGGAQPRLAIQGVVSSTSTTSVAQIAVSGDINASSLTANNLHLADAATNPDGASGINGNSWGTNTGLNIGSWAEAGSAALNIGQGGKATTAKNSATNIGGAFFARNTGTSPIELGLFAGLMNATPTFASAAAIFDNGSVAAPIALFRDNGTTRLSVLDGGKLLTASGSLPQFAGADGDDGVGIADGQVALEANGVNIVVAVEGATDALLPGVDGTTDLGSAAFQYDDGFFQDDLDVGGSITNADTGTVDIAGGLNVSSNVIVTGTLQADSTITANASSIGIVGTQVGNAATPQVWRLPTVIGATSTPPACAATTDEAKVYYVRDTDAGAGTLCVCIAINATPTFALRRMVDETTACPDP